MYDKFTASSLIVSFLKRPAPPWRPIPSRVVAKELACSLQGLANWRVRETGPPYEPHKRGQGNRVYYRPDKIMSWLSEMTGNPAEPWEFCRQWLEWKGLRNMDHDQRKVEQVIELMDRNRYFPEYPISPRRSV